LPTAEFYRRLREEVGQFDLVHLHSLWNPVISVAAFACREAGVPYLLSPRGMLQAGALGRKKVLKRIYYRLLERRTLAGARALHFFTEAEARDSKHLLNNNISSFVVPSGVETDLATAVQRGRFRKAYPFLQGKRIMLFLGRLHWSKGLELQAQALGHLVKRFPDLVWVLVGPDGGDWARLLGQVCHTSGERHIFWTGSLPRQQCLEALADADVFLLTSRHEAHSMAMNEALAIGVPLVITDTVGFDEVKQWGAGYVVPWDPLRLATAVSGVLEHPEQAHKMREAGRRLAADRLAWPKVAEAMARVYDEVTANLAQKRPPASRASVRAG
jgi:glycosyltransferase involved in cell wall biosynthesis